MPGEFVADPTEPWSAASYLRELRVDARPFAPRPTSAHGAHQMYIPTELQSAPFVFVRHGAHRGPLRPPYDGPFRVIRPGPKHFVVDMGGRPETVTIDRLKPAHLDAVLQPEVAQPPRRGRPPLSVLDPNAVPFLPERDQNSSK